MPQNIYSATISLVGQSLISNVTNSSAVYFFAVQNISGSNIAENMLLGFLRSNKQSNNINLEYPTDIFGVNYHSLSCHQWLNNGNFYYDSTQSNFTTCSQDWLPNQYCVVSINSTTLKIRFFDQNKNLIANTTNSMTITGTNFLSPSYNEPYYYPALQTLVTEQPVLFEPNFTIAGETNLIAAV